MTVRTAAAGLAPPVTRRRNAEAGWGPCRLLPMAGQAQLQGRVMLARGCPRARGHAPARLGRQYAVWPTKWIDGNKFRAPVEYFTNVRAHM